MTAIESTQAKKGNLLLIGDLLIDKTWPVNATKLSPEGPVPVAQLSSKEAIETPGGAGLAASFGTKNFQDMNLTFFTATTKSYCNWLRDKGIKTIFQPIEPQRVINKIRYIDEASRYHLLRVDNDDIAGKSCIDFEYFRETFRLFMSQGINGIVLLDYRKGIFDDEEMLSYLITTAREYNIPIYVDSRAGNLQKFTGVTCLKLNNKEFQQACENLGCRYPLELISILELESLLITKGEEGAELWEKGDTEGYSYRAPLDPYPGAPDVTGCGDAFDISFCYYRFIEVESSKNSMIKAVDMATNYAHMPIEERLC